MCAFDFRIIGNSERDLQFNPNFCFTGMCEALWQPDMTPDELFECISQALTNAVDRDASSGWGAVVHIIEADKITTKQIKTRMD